MTQTTHLALPFLDAAQAQKHVTHNEALTLIDALTQLAISSRNVMSPPVTPAEGDRLLVGAGATGDFAGKTNQVATFLAGGWSFLAPQAGWRAYIEAEQLLLLYDGAAWIDCGLSLRQLQNLSLLGVGATADGANPLLAKLNATLFTAKGVSEGGSGDLRFALNKENAAKTVSQLYQSNYSGRAETGLTGDDDFHVKVSPDGATWKEAVVVDKTTGQPKFPQGVGDGAPFSFRNRLRNASFAINQRAVSGTVTLAAGAYGHDGVKAGASGCTYTFAASGIETTITISAGSLIMPIEAGMIEGGVYTLSQAGTAQARVWQGTGYTGSGTYAACPLQTSGLTANAQTNVEFSTGTILRPQFEKGAFATSFARRPRTIERLLCMRYFQTSYADGVAPGTAGAAFGISQFFPASPDWLTLVALLYPVPMAATPTITPYSPNSGASGKAYANNVGADYAVYASAGNDKGATITVLGGTGLGAGQGWRLNLTLSAEI